MIGIKVQEVIMGKKLDPLEARVVILLTVQEKEYLKLIARDEARSLSAHVRYLCLKEIDEHLDDD